MFTYALGNYLDDPQEMHDAWEKFESQIGRYPKTFRFYENYHAYKDKFPESTLEEYQVDMNSPITFDEYLELNKVYYVAMATENPWHYFQNRMARKLRDTTPEEFVQSDRFKKRL